MAQYKLKPLLVFKGNQTLVSVNALDLGINVMLRAM